MRKTTWKQRKNEIKYIEIKPEIKNNENDKKVYKYIDDWLS